MYTWRTHFTCALHVHTYICSLIVHTHFPSFALSPVNSHTFPGNATLRHKQAASTVDQTRASAAAVLAHGLAQCGCTARDAIEFRTLCGVEPVRRVHEFVCCCVWSVCVCVNVFVYRDSCVQCKVSCACGFCGQTSSERTRVCRVFLRACKPVYVHMCFLFVWFALECSTLSIAFRPKNDIQYLRNTEFTGICM